MLKATAKLPFKKLYLRDLNQAWYHQGVAGMGKDIDEAAGFLRRMIEEEGCEKVAMMGGSTGGYGALLFGWLLEAHLVHAFNPPTYIGPLKRIWKGDFLTLGWPPLKWKLLLRTFGKSPRFSRKYADLKTLFRTRTVRCEFHIHFSRHSRKDRRHALRMGTFPNVVLHEYEERTHSLKAHMREGSAFREKIFNSLFEL